MKHTTWNPRRALTFARGLYHVAACDGVTPREAETIRRFIAAANLDVEMAALGLEAFDYDDAAQALDSPWIRRIFVEAAMRMTRLDGRISDQERDAMRAISAALGLGERRVLEALDEPCDDAEIDLVEWVSNQPIDQISWDDDAHRGLFWRFPHQDHPIAEGAILKVATGQAAVVHVAGQIADTLEPGEHAFSPRRLVGLRDLKGWHEGPVTAEITFASTARSRRCRWGTADPVQVHDPKLGTFPVRAFGCFRMCIANVGRVFERFASRELPTSAGFEARVRNIIAGRFAHALATLADERHGITELIDDLDVLASACQEKLRPRLADSGIDLFRFVIEHVTLPLELGLPPPRRSTITTSIASDALPGDSLGGHSFGGASDGLKACQNCLSPMPQNARFCSSCGASLRGECVGCAAEIHAGARFCPECGASQG